MLILLAVTSTGCNDSTSSGSTAVTMSGAVSQVLPGTSGPGDPVAGVEVCQFASNNCATTDDDGLYELRLLKGREIELSYVKDGYGPVLVATLSGIVDFVLDVGVSTNADLEDFFTAVGSPYPPQGTGYLSATSTREGSALAGVSYGLLGSGGRSFYLDDAGVPDTSLQETETPGVGGFVEVAPVNVTLSVTGAVNCVSERSWPAAANDAFRLPVRVGFWTQTILDCE